MHVALHLESPILAVLRSEACIASNYLTDGMFCRCLCVVFLGSIQDEQNARGHCENLQYNMESTSNGRNFFDTNRARDTDSHVDIIILISSQTSPHNTPFFPLIFLVFSF